MLWCLFAAEPRGRELGGVAGGLHLLGERELVRGQSQGEVDSGIERLGRGVSPRRLEPLVELGEGLLDLAEHLEIHGGTVLDTPSLRRNLFRFKLTGNGC